MCFIVTFCKVLHNNMFLQKDWKLWWTRKIIIQASRHVCLALKRKKKLLKEVFSKTNSSFVMLKQKSPCCQKVEVSGNTYRFSKILENSKIGMWRGIFCKESPTQVGLLVIKCLQKREKEQQICNMHIESYNSNLMN